MVSLGAILLLPVPENMIFPGTGNQWAVQIV